MERERAFRADFSLQKKEEIEIGSFSQVVLSPGIPLSSSSLRGSEGEGIPIVGEAELGLRASRQR